MYLQGFKNSSHRKSASDFLQLAQNKHTREGRCWREVEGLGSVWDQRQDATGAQIGARSSPSATLVAAYDELKMLQNDTRARANHL